MRNLSTSLSREGHTRLREPLQLWCNETFLHRAVTMYLPGSDKTLAARVLAGLDIAKRGAWCQPKVLGRSASLALPPTYPHIQLVF